jgi:hypothetical protein
MSTVFLGLKFYVPIVLRIHNVVLHHLLTSCTYNSYMCHLYCNLCAEDFHTQARLKIQGAHSHEDS